MKLITSIDKIDNGIDSILPIPVISCQNRFYFHQYRLLISVLPIIIFRNNSYTFRIDVNGAFFLSGCNDPN